MRKQVIYFLMLLVGVKASAQINADLLLNIHQVANTTEMNAIVNPSEGILVFNVAEDGVFIYNGTIWVGQDGDILHTPSLVNTTLKIERGTNNELLIYGSNFNLNTQLVIESAAGVLQSFSVASPQLIKANFTASNTPGFYDITVSQNGYSNTIWADNATDKLEVWGFDGSTQERAGTTCKSILDDGLSSGDGLYWINPDGGTTDNAFQAECDMTTDGGGWTKVEYVYDFYVENYWSTGDARRWLTSNFTLYFTDDQIDAIRSASTEAKQKYVGVCDGVITYYYTKSSNYNSAFGFRYHTGFETANSSSTYPNTNITVTSDGCAANNGTAADTVFEINDIRLPIINVSSKDSGNGSERFGSPLMENPAWFR